MTDEELKEYRAKILEDCKKYSRIDYEDDDDILELMIDTTLEEMSELIPTFDSENLSSRQRSSCSFRSKIYMTTEKNSARTRG